MVCLNLETAVFLLYRDSLAFYDFRIMRCKGVEDVMRISTLREDLSVFIFWLDAELPETADDIIRGMGIKNLPDERKAPMIVRQQ